MPRARDALELMVPALLEPEAGTGNEILDDARDQHLAGGRKCAETGSYGDGDSHDLAVGHLTFARMETGPDLDAER